MTCGQATFDVFALHVPRKLEVLSQTFLARLSGMRES